MAEAGLSFEGYGGIGPAPTSRPEAVGPQGTTGAAADPEPHTQGAERWVVRARLMRPGPGPGPDPHRQW